jgi:hypothetical protein
MGRHASGQRRSRLGEAGSVATAGAVDDLRLLVRKKHVLVLSLVAVVGIFAAYYGVLALTGHRGSWLLFLIVPAGLSGFAVGALLDHAHRVRAAPPSSEDEPAEPANPAPEDEPTEPAEPAEAADPDGFAQSAENPELTKGP